MGINTWKPNKKEDMDFLKELLEAGKIKSVIDRRYPLGYPFMESWKFILNPAHFKYGLLPGFAEERW